MNWNKLWQRPDGPRYAAFSDIDNTYHLPGLQADSRRLSERLAELDMPLVAVTGARFSSAHRRILSGELPPFAVVASSVGTEIRVVTDVATAIYQEDLSWRARMIATGFNLNHGAVQALRELVDRLRFERPEWGVVVQPGDPEAFKFSLHYFAPDTDEAASIAAELGRPCEGLRQVWCYDINSPPGRKRFCFDVLAADKADLVNYMAEAMGLTGGLVAGDSGNDAGMILHARDDLLGVVVGGATPELLAEVEKTDLRGRGKRLFVDHPSTRRGPQSLLAAVEQHFNT